MVAPGPGGRPWCSSTECSEPTTQRPRTTRRGRLGARLVGVVAAVALLVAGFAAPGLTATPGASTLGARLAQAGITGPGHEVHFGSRGEVDVNVCSDAVRAGFAHCDAHLRADLLGMNAAPHPATQASPRVEPNSGIGNQGAYDPAFLQSAYNAPAATAGSGQTVAIVDAFDDPSAEADLAAYRTEFALPACTTANGCFRKVNQNGGTTYPAANAGWEREISLDVDMVSAMCPLCHILLVEADDDSFANLGTAVNRAVSMGANVVSNSYGGTEDSSETFADAAYFNHPGVAIVASTGDGGYGVNYPASSPDVVAVGGTSLLQATNTGTRDATETAWSGAGSGCSTVEAKPAWQHDAGCAHRTVADVAAVADPNTGVWVYDQGWGVFGGTSVASPIIGSMYALAGNAASSDNLSSYAYSHLSDMNDVVSGSNGSCGGSYLCTSGAGYDGPTGLGTPDSPAAFTPPDGPPPPQPDFSVAATPIVSAIRPGGVVKSTITLTEENGFAGSVHLSATVSSSAGVTPSFSPVAAAVGVQAGTSTLSVTGHAAGTYQVTVRATHGALVHTRVLSVTVNDFSIKITPTTLSVVRGKTTHYVVTLTRLGTFSSLVTLAVTGLRARDRVTYSRNPAPVSSAQTITITTSTLDAAGTLTLHISASSGSLSHSIVATLVLK